MHKFDRLLDVLNVCFRNVSALRALPRWIISTASSHPRYDPQRNPRQARSRTPGLPRGPLAGPARLGRDMPRERALGDMGKCADQADSSPFPMCSLSVRILDGTSRQIEVAFKTFKQLNANARTTPCYTSLIIRNPNPCTSRPAHSQHILLFNR